MNKFITTIILFSMFIFSSTVAAEKRNKDTKEHQTTIIPHRHENHRPKAPSMIYLICHYNTGYISLSFPEDANYMEISISDETGPVWIGTISRTNPETEIPILSGEYTITCQTDQNQIFEGTLLFTN